jgi:hypothetical protein
LFVDGKPFTVDGTLVTASRSQYELGFTFGKATPGDGEAKVAYTQSTTGTTFGLSFTLKGNATAASYVFTTAGLFDNKPDTNATRVVSGAKMDVQYKGSIGSSQDPKVIHIFDLRLKGVSAQ